MSVDCLTRDGILRALEKDGLNGFCEVVEARKIAGYERTKNLPEFIVLGRFLLDSRGNLGFCTFEIGNEDVSRLVRLASTPVAHLDNFGAVFPKLIWRATVTMPPRPLPTANSVCQECGEGWTLDNCDDVFNGFHGDLRLLHKKCFLLMTERETLAMYRKMFAEAGLGEMNVDSILNEYWGADGPPWVLMRTPKGDLRVGHRKRVYHLDWENLKVGPEVELDAKVLFPNEDTTKEGRYIHAWTEAKLVEYLLKLSEAANIGKFKKGAQSK